MVDLSTIDVNFWGAIAFVVVITILESIGLGVLAKKIQAVEVMVKQAMSPNSPGGVTITPEELAGMKDVFCSIWDEIEQIKGRPPTPAPIGAPSV